MGDGPSNHEHVLEKEHVKLLSGEKKKERIVTQAQAKLALLILSYLFSSVIKWRKVNIMEIPITRWS